MTGRDTPRVALAGLLFLLSGAAALVYQVAWQRLLALHSGVGLYSVAMISADFSDITAGRSAEKRHALAIRVEGGEVLPEKSFQAVVRARE